MYSITLLKDRQFDKLPYKHTEESLGLADYKNKKAYVRESGIPALDLLVMGHEIQELVAQVSPHEEDGIRYKKGGAARSIVPIVLGAVGTIIGGPVLGAVLGGLSGGGMGAYAASNHPDQLGSPLMGGLGGAFSGALGGYGAGQLLSGGLAGLSANTGSSLLSKIGSFGQGALFGTGTSAGGNTFSLLGQGGRSVGLFGPGTMLGGLASSTLGKSAMGLLGTNAVSTMLNSNAQSKQPTNDQYVPAQFSGFNSATPITGSVQTIKSTPSPITGWSSTEQKSNLVDKNLSNFDMLIPGRNRQGNIYTWA